MSADRTAVVKLLKSRGAKARRGHLRIPVGDLFWYVDVLADGVGPAAPLRLEVGCWTAALPPEPDGGAVDCPLLMDVPLGGDPTGATDALLDRVTAIGDLATLGRTLTDLPGALVDQRLRDLL
ncbi:hypothetical protein FHP29_01825 [Nocardioides albidus]|uniref:Uncharacterized protein n=1 Tax=Nocardioides albidus TaxID=1517589 RepID=A0A5C4WJH8_9ACTN|nr:hypothetical protein [Nocardioides albidus]TNM48271.1 hypothetical protein FHP29_01825 [Nocardioides albidus]